MKIRASFLLALLANAVVPLSAGAAGASAALAGSVLPRTGAFIPSGPGDVTKGEIAGQPDNAAAPAPFSGHITARSLSRGSGQGASVSASDRQAQGPNFEVGFEGLNHYQQRYSRGGNQFSVEPPDQGLCVGNGYVVEVVNDVFNVFNASGQSQLPDNTATNIVSGLPRDVNHAIDLNSFLGYAPAINRATGVRAQSVTDPSCLYDSQTGRFFLIVLTLETNPNGSLTLVNHLDLAVSQTSDPTAAWNVYHVDVTNDGTNAGGVNPGPFLGDYPHIGADAYGIYVTTNAYPWNSNGFGGAQIYAFSKAQLAAGSSSVTMVHLDTFGAVPVSSSAGSTQPGFTVWPSQTPAGQSVGGEQGGDDQSGTEYFLSSNAAAEAKDPVNGTNSNYISNQIVVWKLRHTETLNSSTPTLSLSTKIVSVNQYALPPKAIQPDSSEEPNRHAPLGHCINDTLTPLIFGVDGCWQLLFGSEPAHNEVGSTLDSNDTRMQQVMYVNGLLWGALDTAVNPNGGPTRAGILWFAIDPHGASVVKQGYLGAVGYDLTYPAITLTSAGRGLMAFTATGSDLNPSAAYAAVDASAGVTSWALVPGGEGGAPDDGFTSYVAEVGSPPRTRWGDFGAAVVDGNTIWIASEYIAQRCSYASWGGPFFTGGMGDNLLGTCADSAGGIGNRTALANWATRISRFTP